MKKKLQNFLVINKATLSILERSEHVLNANITYWLKTGDLVALKKGTYVLRERFEKEPQKSSYLEYLANQLLAPSYVSGEYVMAQHQLLTEMVYAITSMTTKLPRAFITKVGSFRYFALTQRLFTGYRIECFYDAPVFIAEKPKALFDYLYLRFHRGTPVHARAIEELRINWDLVNRKEFEQAAAYLMLTRSVRVRRAFSIIKQLYYA